MNVPTRRFAPAIKDSYLRGRLAQVFDGGNRNSPMWSLEDAHQVRAALDRLRWLEGERRG